MSKLCIENLTVTFETDRGSVNAVDDVSFSLQKGEILGIAGESGSGKSTIASSILGLVHPVSGRILFDNRNLLSLSEKEMDEIRGCHISLIGQDPSSSLNPFRRIAPQITDVLRAHRKMKKSEAEEKAIEMLSRAGMQVPEKVMKAYPHQLSGGMKQRVMIAMALSQGAEILIADEPTSSLDVTIQAQIITLLKKLNKEFGTSIIFISHNLEVLETLADRIIIMYSGRIAEIANTEALFSTPLHPYTEALLAASPKPFKIPKPISGIMERNKGDVKGCLFSARCPRKTEKCILEKPPLAKLGERYLACWEAKDE